ncbi:L-type lectin-domain containing receptor kinase IX.1-like [Nymphaea colorata]|uniref:non-specific serine/threonine protein kinase n=1 Tax=Nymphaea colorata TaxID=210225 RepID=A0A5K1GNN2_9MAGN|nr:L-type lectin-domain containing receptor kinase IX.1-like [Nymphaea colorata]
MSLLAIFFAFILLSFIHCSTSLTRTFTFPSFSDGQNLTRYGDAFITAEGYLDLTSTAINKNVTNSTGWAIYAKPITLYDARTGFAADFQSNFSFEISHFKSNCQGDGLAFFMAPVNWTHKAENNGYGLGIFNKSSGADNSQMIAVEFDTYYNSKCDKNNTLTNHMGIDVNSCVSNASTFWDTNVETVDTNATALVQYDSTTGNLSSHMMDRNGSSQWYTSFVINLTTVLPETVIVGFSASTGACSEGHRIVSWNFSITTPNQTPAPAPGPISNIAVSSMQNKTVLILVACLVPLTIVVVVVIIIVFMRKRKNEKVELKEEEEEEEAAYDFADMTMNFETGPRKFRYGELAAATNDFSEGGKLGQGGFGGVYRGTLGDTKEVVAVKRFSKGSSQGKKEYAAEVTVISRLRHRNLVRLIGWCHERGEFLLVYEYMEGGSLDSHLFSSKGCPVLPWAQRRKVALGLASAVLYLHDEWEQCVVHRDIKLSNVMVDSEFNARLGDFGLARLTNHGFAARTTMVAGTVGYLAPECVITGKFSTQSDVYSFGVVLLEIATGRRAIRPIGEKEARLVEWIWELYGIGSLLTAVDERLGSDFNQQEMERMMVVGLWCVHPDPERRPTIREAIKALSLQAEVPSLPQKMPMPFYAPPPMNGLSSLFTSSSSGTTTTTTSTSTTVSSTVSAEVALLKSQG